MVVRIQRLLTDRGSTSRSKAFAATCQQLSLAHRFTQPYRPQTIGKAERFIQTITREWAYARPYDLPALTTLPSSPTIFMAITSIVLTSL